MLAIHIKAELHDDTLILSIDIYSQNAEASRARTITETESPL